MSSGPIVSAALAALLLACGPCSAQQQDDDDNKSRFGVSPISDIDRGGGAPVVRDDSDSPPAPPGISGVMPKLSNDSPEAQTMKMMGTLVQPPISKVHKGFAEPVPDSKGTTTGGNPSLPENPSSPAPSSYGSGVGGSFSSADQDGGSGGSSAGSGGQVGAAVPGDSAQMNSSEQRAAGSARNMADSLKNGFSDAGNLPGAAGAAAMAGGKWTPGGASGDPSRPRTQADLLLAPQASLDAVGLKVGRGPDRHMAILTASGGPASPAQVAQLYRQVSSDPTVLTRYPDMFNRLPGGRAEFESLKQAAPMPGSAGDGPFKDVGLSEDRRDIDWSKSCSEVSGDCNQVVKSKSYKKGDHLPPEDLDAIWEDIKTEMAGDDRSRPDVLKAKVFNRSAGSLLARLAAAFTGRGSDDAVPSPVPVSQAVGRAESASAGGPAAAARVAASGPPVSAPPMPGSLASAAGGGSGLVAGGCLLVGGAALAWWVLRRKRDIDKE